MHVIRLEGDALDFVLGALYGVIENRSNILALDVAVDPIDDAFKMALVAHGRARSTWSPPLGAPLDDCDCDDCSAK